MEGLARRGSWAEVAEKNKFSLGDTLEIMTPQGNLNCSLAAMQDGRGAAVEVAPGDGHRVWIAVPEAVSLAFALLLRNFPDGSSTRDPHGKLLTV